VLFWGVETIDYLCLGIIYILIIQLVFKLYLKSSINLNLSKLLGNNLNSKVEYYLNKIIKWNKQMSVFWIWLIFTILICGLSGSVYFINGMLINLDKFVNSHNSANNNIVTTLFKSIEDGLFSLEIINYMSLALIISLIIILLFRFHFDRRISAFYIWALVITLIVTLAISGYISDDLYTNIDSYVNIYNNLRTK
jgi:hypothetical protein